MDGREGPCKEQQRGARLPQARVAVEVTQPGLGR